MSDAIFNGGQGDIPVSVYFLGIKVPKIYQSIIQKNDLEEISIFPNPIIGNKFTIDFGQMIQAKINIISIDGKLIYMENITNQIKK